MEDSRKQSGKNLVKLLMSLQLFLELFDDIETNVITEKIRKQGESIQDQLEQVFQHQLDLTYKEGECEETMQLGINLLREIVNEVSSSEVHDWMELLDAIKETKKV